jgi:hypothetical protein
MTPSRGFSDDRLRILKNIELKQTAKIVLSHTEIEALLARLEAAERLINYCTSLDQSNRYGRQNRYEAWRKSCGK